MIEVMAILLAFDKLSKYNITDPLRQISLTALSMISNDKEVFDNAYSIPQQVTSLLPLYYRPRSRGDNMFGSVRLFVFLFVCLFVSKWLGVQNCCCFDRLRHRGRSRF